MSNRHGTMSPPDMLPACDASIHERGYRRSSSLSPGEADQFNWSHGIVLLNGTIGDR